MFHTYVAMVKPKLAIRVRKRRTLVIMTMNLYSVEDEGSVMNVLELNIIEVTKLKMQID